jgi:hypothetical protein
MLRTRDDPDEVWRCCGFWQRLLLNKWNAREFASRHGTPVAKLYWRGSDPSAAPLEALPDRFVIRPVRGTNREGVAVVVDGSEHLHGGSASPAELRERMPRTRLLRRPVPVLIEEFATPHAGGPLLPYECKCHVFGDHVAAVELLLRTSAHDAKHRYYTTNWEPIPDRINTYAAEDHELRDPPAALEGILAAASSLGAGLGTYMRIDFFVTDSGFMFNEFSSLPLGGEYNTPYCNRLFGEAWAERIPGST